MSGTAFEPSMVKLHKGEQNSDEYKALNPRGQVPVLVSNGQVVTQIVAIVLYLDQLFPQAGFLPTEPLARAQASIASFVALPLPVTCFLIVPTGTPWYGMLWCSHQVVSVAIRPP